MNRENSHISMDRDQCYQALLSRDKRYDGKFFTAVMTTGIFCRPVCPARPPKKENCSFLPSAGAAMAAGFRPCLRCRPEVSPELPGWRGTASTVTKALRMINDGALNEGSVEDLADRVGLGSRHLRRLFDQHLGASPKEIADTRRLLFAKQLITETSLPLTEVALAAGYNSLRRFNDAFHTCYKKAPRDMRRGKQSDTGEDGGLQLTLRYTPPYSWFWIRNYFKGRTLKNIENITDTSYQRSFELNGRGGYFTAKHLPDQSAFRISIFYPEISHLAPIVGRIRQLFDLDCNIQSVNDYLRQDPRLDDTVSRNPGIRIPGCWDPFELSIRAILGQQVSVEGGTTLTSRLVRKLGRPLVGAPANLSLIFPRPEDVAGADLSDIGIPKSRQDVLKLFSAKVADDPDFLFRPSQLDELIQSLCALKGIGPWTANYIAMRGLREPDAFPVSDLGLIKALDLQESKKARLEMLQIAENWRPFRAYATMYLWSSLTQETHK
ncbi:DNA-3-methyladenine glycosylase 2 family protein [Emcibacter sp.]|uniref:DNA-3-methyladenine glycosylase 2 family protein n=1 Tax=Emcibacter sp. TaxID=1979954 RepID=UPI002AA63593|nr:DNA-3-methyladenine glycosylase 2 family protein [Emcibacter sp.]